MITLQRRAADTAYVPQNTAQKELNAVAATTACNAAAMSCMESAGRYSPKGITLNLFSMCVFVTPVARGVPMPSASHRWRRSRRLTARRPRQIIPPYDARLPGAALALEGEPGHVPGHVRDAALGLKKNWTSGTWSRGTSDQRHCCVRSAVGAGRV